MPANLYGPGDNFDLFTSHVLPAMIRKFHEAKVEGASEIVVWGPASPEASLRDRIARYISAPLAPVEVRELPSLLTFHEADSLEWRIGPARHARRDAGPGDLLDP